jgi:hypothetical protein
MIREINLPPPSQKILEKIERMLSITEIDLELALKRKHDYIQKFRKNSVSRKFLEDDEELNQLSQNEYKIFFNEKFHASLGIIRNIETEKYACWPPHTDRVRIFALNYYLREGGEYVTTVTYNTLDNNIAGAGTGKIYKYEDLSVDKTYHLKMNSWYALSVRQAHSIENIENMRLIFTLSFHDITYHEFESKYNHLFC